MQRTIFLVCFVGAQVRSLERCRLLRFRRALSYRPKSGSWEDVLSGRWQEDVGLSKVQRSLISSSQQLESSKSGLFGETI
jgi:hypothetical protein